MVEPLVLRVAEYMPDLPDTPGVGTATALNVVPRTPLSYGPVGSPVSIGANGLTARCQGAQAFVDKVGTVYLFAGDATTLYQYVNGSWTSVAKAGGYNIDATLQWEYEFFNGSIIATDYADNLQSVTLGSGAKFADLAGSPPKAKHIALVKNSFLVLGNTSDSVNGAMFQRVWWSGAGDATSWSTPGSAAAAQVQGGAVDLLSNFGPIQAIRTGVPFADAIIFMQYAIKLMQYVGPPVVFEFLPAAGTNGTPAPYSPVVTAGVAYYLAWDGFYSFDGTTLKPIGANKVDRTFFADLDMTAVDRVVGAADPTNKLVMWAYPGAGHDSNYNPNRLIIYNWQLDRWSLANVNAETLCRMMGIGYSLDQLYTVLGYTLDGVNPLPASLDSPLWQGNGQLLLGLFDATHLLNYLSGPPLVASINTQEIQPFPGKRTFIRSARPLVDASGENPVKVAVGHREKVQDTLTTTTAVSLNSLGACPARTSGRYIRGEVAIPAGTAWTHFSGIELDCIPQGSR